MVWPERVAGPVAAMAWRELPSRWQWGGNAMAGMGGGMGGWEAWAACTTTITIITMNSR